MRAASSPEGCRRPDAMSMRSMPGEKGMRGYRAPMAPLTNPARAQNPGAAGPKEHHSQERNSRRSRGIRDFLSGTKYISCFA